MSQVGNNDNQFSGPYMVQDSDHMSGVNQSSSKANRSSARQVDQSQAASRQQGADHGNNSQQGGEKRRKGH